MKKILIKILFSFFLLNSVIFLFIFSTITVEAASFDTEGHEEIEITVDYNDLARANLFEDLISPNINNHSRSASQTYTFNITYMFNLFKWKKFTIEVTYYDNLVFTPNGTDVSMPNSSDMTTYYVCKYKGEIPSDIIEDMNEKNYDDYLGVEKVADPIVSYNCHSYAWYSQDITTNDVWIGYPNAYYDQNDMSYEIVSEPRIGDIICYFDTDLATEKQNIHSGIIVDYADTNSNNVCGDANKYLVQSKWGMQGLYTHKGDICPYVSDADEVKYFRPRTSK